MFSTSWAARHIQDELLAVLAEMMRNSNTGFVVEDLNNEVEFDIESTSATVTYICGGI